LPSFDIVSEVDFHEVDNALSQVRKEIETRYDFRGGKNKVDYENGIITLVGDDDMKMDAMRDMLNQKMAKRGVSNKALDFQKVEEAASSQKKQVVKIKNGITTEEGKKLVKLIKDQKMKKIQASVQQEQVRVTGPKRDALQEVISFLKENVSELELQFTNFRD